MPPAHAPQSGKSPNRWSADVGIGSIDHRESADACVVTASPRIVWLVDDDPLVRGLAANRGAGAGVEMVLFEGGKEVLEALQESSPYLLVIDNEMPKMRGVSVGPLARSLGYSGPMVLWTASPTREVIQRASKAGFDRVLSKSIPLEQVLADVGLAA